MKYGQGNRRAVVPMMLLGVSLAACSTPVPATSGRVGRQTLNVARTALLGGNPQMALTVTNAVLKSDPHDAEALVERGDAEFALGQCVAAAKSYRSALRLRPRAAEAELGLGRCALPTDPREAANDFARATRDAPGNQAAFNDLGIALADQSRFGPAEMAFETARRLDPSLQAATVNLGLALALGGDPGRAETILGPIVRGASATPTIRADYATALALAGHPQAATRVLVADMPAAEAQAMVAEMVRLNDLSPGTAAAKARNG